MTNEAKKTLENKKKNWEENIFSSAPKKNTERAESFDSTSGFKFDRLYIPDSSFYDIESKYTDEIGFPGDFPFTRGIQPTMYRGKFWTMRQYAGFGTAKESNERYHYLLANGQTGLSVAFDLPTQMGYDSDDLMAEGEVGRTGVAIDTIDDMAILFDKIPLDKVSTSMTINSTASILLSFYMGVASKQGVGRSLLRGTIQNDILKEYIARGTYIYPPRQSMRLITDIFSYCKDFLPNWNTISISGYHIREAGASAVQEVAFTLADGIAYVESALSAGLDVDSFAPQLSFFFNVHNNFLEEVAKFRAARRLWAKIMKNRFKAKNPKSQMLRFHTQTAGSTLTAKQVDVNVVRVTIQALAAVLGGTQSLHTNSMDEALALPTESSARLALRTQQVIANESGVADIVDLMGGSWALETLTDKIESEALVYISKIDDMGGMVSAIEKGFPQKEIQDSAYNYQLEIESSKRKIVGVNSYCDSEVEKTPILKIDPQLEIDQIRSLNLVRSTRDNSKVKDSLSRLESAALGTENLLPYIYQAALCRATLGEISATLSSVFGRYKEIVFI